MHLRPGYGNETLINIKRSTLCFEISLSEITNIHVYANVVTQNNVKPLPTIIPMEKS